MSPSNTVSFILNSMRLMYEWDGRWFVDFFYLNGKVRLINTQILAGELILFIIIINSIFFLLVIVFSFVLRCANNIILKIANHFFAAFHIFWFSIRFFCCISITSFRLVHGSICTSLVRNPKILLEHSSSTQMYFECLSFIAKIVCYSSILFFFCSQNIILLLILCVSLNFKFSYIYLWMCRIDTQYEWIRIQNDRLECRLQYDLWIYVRTRGALLWWYSQFTIQIKIQCKNKRNTFSVRYFFLLLIIRFIWLFETIV